jgi:hypothetical protein
MIGMRQPICRKGELLKCAPLLRCTLRFSPAAQAFASKQQSLAARGNSSATAQTATS